MIYRVEFMRPNETHWTLTADTNSQEVAIHRARSVAREPRRERVRVVDANGSVVWIS